MHVTPRENKWTNIISGNQRVTALFETQQEAIDAARTKAITHEDTEVIVHRRDGKIRASNTYNRKMIKKY
ncbi:DUF2188 domain-containing protein (plasmid) [Methanosphaera sp. ISO3-F5]|uniref:DUF2188 domain-containing protein n=1 Tax=Methanosphaera sp. ISO3-F5 TaxID=1452353 RepID=UPI002B262D57|nr:DUF2188 domain-containing protein [Methanosphaera sp. ISO3-F5]WQH65467.1 DUF2188 domain-containing protein [Methanosphaera sp. ISO3-F5]